MTISLELWLEPLPPATDLEQGMRARVADPVWFLARQWQLGEFHGHDAGTPAPAPPAGTVFTQPVNGQCPAGFVKSNVGCHRACSADSDCPSATKCKSGVVGSSKVCTTG